MSKLINSLKEKIKQLEDEKEIKEKENKTIVNKSKEFESRLISKTQECARISEELTNTKNSLNALTKNQNAQNIIKDQKDNFKQQHQTQKRENEQLKETNIALKQSLAQANQKSKERKTTYPNS